MYKEMFGEKLKIARLRMPGKPTQKEVGEALGMNYSTLSNYELGRTEPDIETLGRLADYYGISLDWLLGTGIKKNTEL